MIGFCDTEATARILFTFVSVDWELRVAGGHEPLPAHFVNEK